MNEANISDLFLKLIKISDFFHVSIDSLLREDKDLKNTLNREKTNKHFMPLSDFIGIAIGFWFILQPYVVTNDLWSKIANLGLAISMFGIIISVSHFTAYISDSPVWRRTSNFFKANLLPIVIGLIMLTVALFVLFPGKFFELNLSDKSNLYFGILILILSAFNIILEFINWILNRMLERSK